MEYLEGENDERLYILERIPNFFEDLAVLEEAGAISFDMIRKSLGWTIVTTWDRWKPAIDYLRREKDPDPVYRHFERLANDMRKRLERIDEPPKDESG